MNTKALKSYRIPFTFTDWWFCGYDMFVLTGIESGRVMVHLAWPEASNEAMQFTQLTGIDHSSPIKCIALVRPYAVSRDFGQDL